MTGLATNHKLSIAKRDNIVKRLTNEVLRHGKNINKRILEGRMVQNPERVRKNIPVPLSHNGS